MHITEKYFVNKQYGIYLLDETPPDTHLCDVPSTPWWGNDPEEGQASADDWNAHLLSIGIGHPEHMAFMRARRREKLGLKP